MLNSRQTGIVKYLSRQEDYITIAQLAQEFDISPRTVRNDLDKICDFLNYKQAVIERKPRSGIRLHVSRDYDLDDLLRFQNYRDYSLEERTYVILTVLILSKKTTLEELEEWIGVSKNTIVSDMKLAETMLNEHDIMLKKEAYYGMELEGSEENIRNFLFNIHIRCVGSTTVDIIKTIKDMVIAHGTVIHELMKYVENLEDIKYSDEAITELQGMLLASVHRSGMGKHVTDSPMMKQMEDDLMYFYLQKFFKKYPELEVSNGDICYMSMLFRSMKSLTRRIVSQEDDKELSRICNEVVEDFSRMLDIEIGFEDELTDKFISHLKVAVFRLKNHIKISNPLFEDIQHTSFLMYGLTKKVLKQHEMEFGVVFPKEEIAYITMYFEIFYQKYADQNKKPRIIVVCNGGIATSTLLKQRLSMFLPELPVFNTYRVRDLEEKLKTVHPDFIISTVPLKLSGYRIVKVNPLLNPIDIHRITEMIDDVRFRKKNRYLINQIGEGKRTEVSELLYLEYCQFDADITDWKEAVREAARPLLYNKRIEEKYIGEMIKVVMNMGNYMIFIPEIAFVHAPPDYVNESGMALLILRDKIRFGSKTQDDVKVIVAVANKEENYMLSNLIKLLLKHDNIERIKSAGCYNDILKLEERME